ncbi:MAG: glucose 1-dehydrogenase [Bdellovibrionota bacterium]
MIRERYDLTGKLALVTGASRGIGEAAAIGLAEAGADLVLVSRKMDGLSDVAKKVGSLGRRAVCIPTNIGTETEIEALGEKLAKDDLLPDILVNNAATNPAMGTLLETPDSAWQKVLDVNLTGPLRLCRKIVPLMRKKGGGAIVNVASIGGLRPPAFLGAYGVSKAGLLFLTKVLAVELARYQIRVNCVAPGLVRTQFSKALFDNEMIYKGAISSIKMGRHGEPEEIASVILMLASPASSFMTGEVIVIDGGAIL